MLIVIAVMGAVLLVMPMIVPIMERGPVPRPGMMRRQRSSRVGFHPRGDLVSTMALVQESQFLRSDHVDTASEEGPVPSPIRRWTEVRDKDAR